MLLLRSSARYASRAVCRLAFSVQILWRRKGRRGRAPTRAAAGAAIASRGVKRARSSGPGLDGVFVFIFVEAGIVELH